MRDKNKITSYEHGWILRAFVSTLFLFVVVCLVAVVVSLMPFDRQHKPAAQVYVAADTVPIDTRWLGEWQSNGGRVYISINESIYQGRVGAVTFAFTPSLGHEFAYAIVEIRGIYYSTVFELFDDCIIDPVMDLIKICR
ncbi:MAG: hypothetical protein KAJ07_04555 [Planctomycetes bacterium]|nr:hypothetical protein [Planctomycetota bacterium]